jgi:hypothetical protein
MSDSKDQLSVPIGRRVGLMAMFAGIPISAAWAAGFAGWALAGREFGFALGALGALAGVWLWWKFPEYVQRHPGRVSLFFWIYIAAIGAVAVLTR